MTKRRLARQQRKEPKPKPKYFRFLVLFFFVLFIAYLLVPSHWDGNNPLSLVVAGENEVKLIIFDPDLKKISTLNIPGNTQVSASHQLGTWKIGSLWQLGEQEKLKGNLLADTVMKSFGIPIDEWASSEGAGLISKNQLVKIKAIVTPFSTSLTLKDKVKLAMFSFQNRSNHLNISLENTSFLQKTKLISGEEGYLIRSEAPPQILHLFADPKIITEASRVGLTNSTGSKLLSQEISEIVRALGSKVYFVEDTEADDLDCKVVSRNKNYTAQRLANLLNCELTQGETNNLDINIYLGTRFSERF